MLCEDVRLIRRLLRLPPCTEPRITESRSGESEELCFVCGSLELAMSQSKLWRHETTCRDLVSATMFDITLDSKDAFLAFYELLAANPETPEDARVAALEGRAWIDVLDRGCSERLLALPPASLRSALQNMGELAEDWVNGLANIREAVLEAGARGLLTDEESTNILNNL